MSRPELSRDGSGLGREGGKSLDFSPTFMTRPAPAPHTTRSHPNTLNPLTGGHVNRTACPVSPFFSSGHLNAATVVPRHNCGPCEFNRANWALLGQFLSRWRYTYAIYIRYIHTRSIYMYIIIYVRECLTLTSINDFYYHAQTRTRKIDARIIVQYDHRDMRRISKGADKSPGAVNRIGK